MFSEIEFTIIDNMIVLTDMYSVWAIMSAGLLRKKILENGVMKKKKKKKHQIR